MKKLIIVAISLIILGGGAYCIKYISDVKKYKNIVQEISVDKIDLSKVEDGDYMGTFDAIVISAKVNVTVQNHEIILERVVKAQSLQIDTVSGATNSSKVILKAIENALVSGEN